VTWRYIACLDSLAAGSCQLASATALSGWPPADGMDGLALAAAAASVLSLVNFAPSEAVSLFYSADFSKIQILIS